MRVSSGSDTPERRLFALWSGHDSCCAPERCGWGGRPCSHCRLHSMHRGAQHVGRRGVRLQRHVQWGHMRVVQRRVRARRLARHWVYQRQRVRDAEWRVQRRVCRLGRLVRMHVPRGLSAGERRPHVCRVRRGQRQRTLLWSRGELHALSIELRHGGQWHGVCVSVGFCRGPGRANLLSPCKSHSGRAPGCIRSLGRGGSGCDRWLCWYLQLQRQRPCLDSDQCQRRPQHHAAVVFEIERVVVAARADLSHLSHRASIAIRIPPRDGCVAAAHPAGPGVILRVD